MTAELRIFYPDLVDAIELALRLAGVPEDVRRVEAEVMAEADLMGVPSHGVRMLPNLVRGLREGRASAAPRMQVLRDRGAACVLDCDNGPGRYCAVTAMQRAVEKAKKCGVGVCLAVHTTHWGRAYSYAARAARAGMIGLCTTNALPNMVAWGSDKPLLGNNPLAIGVPRGAGLEPIVLDIAMSQAAVGKVGTYLREGKEVPLGWGLDKTGQPTHNPAEIVSSQRFLPMGEHKGIGLALMMEFLTGALGGLYVSHEIGRIDSTALDPNATKFFLALDIDAFSDKESFAAKIQDLAAFLTSSADPGMEITFPGELSVKSRERYSREGIPIHPDIVKDLRSIGMFTAE